MATYDDGSNIIFDTVNDDSIDAEGGNDSITVTYGRDYVDGGSGDDVLVVRWGDAIHDVYTEISRALPGTRTYVDTHGSWDESARRVLHNGIDHYDVISGSGDDMLHGWSNSWDRFDGGAGTDVWRDSFSALTTGLVVTMAEVASETGVTFYDGTVVANIERAWLTLTQGDDLFMDQGHLDDIVYGDAGNDRLKFIGGVDYAHGGDGEDVLEINWGDATDAIYIGNSRGLPGTRAYVDTDGSWDASTRRVLHNGFEHYDVTGGSGDDEFNGWSNSWDHFDGGEGTDRWRDSLLGWTEAVNVNMGTASTAEGLSLADGTHIARIEATNLTLTAHDDYFSDYGENNDAVYGDAGNDRMKFHGGNDYGHGGDGDDVLILDWSDATHTVYTDNSRGLPGTRTYEDTDGSWADSTRSILHNAFEHYDVRSGSGDDVFNGWYNSWDKFHGGGGTDSVRDSFTAHGSGLSLSMKKASSIKGQGLSDGSQLKSIERVDIWMTEHNDRFSDHGAYDDVVRMMGGNDRATHTNGRDYVDGGEGRDLLKIKWGNATEDSTVENYRDSFAYVDTPNFWTNAERRIDFAGIERIQITFGSGDDRASLGDDNDRAKMGGGGDTAYMRGGKDYVAGLGGHDYLDGGAGEDRVIGGNGHDTLIGGDGNDILKGGKGRDHYTYDDLDDGNDRVIEFRLGQDKFDVSGLGLSEDDISIRVARKSGDTIVEFGDTRISIDDVTGRGSLGIDDFILA